MKGTLQTFYLIAVASISLSAFNVVGAVPSGYYDSLEGKSGVELKQAVKALVSDHTIIDYGDADPNNSFKPVTVATWVVFEESDTRMIDNHLCWWDMYSANNVWVADRHPGLNIEHSVANSWWGGKSGSTSAYNDLHHLNPSNGDANGQKSNWPLGEIEGDPYWSNGVTTTGTPKSDLGALSTRVFEPYKSYKGDFARAYFYIFTVYDDIPWKDDYNWMYNVASDLTLRPWASDLLLKWASEDPVSQKEMNRNEAVYKYQNNRNPFIDCPQLADHIWGSKQNEPFHYSLYSPAEENPADYPGWDEIFPDMHKGQWVPITSDNDLQEGTEFFIVSPTKNRAMTYKLISTGKAIDECLYSPLMELSSYPDVLTGVPQDIATVKLEKENNDWYVGVYDPQNNFQGYINVKTKNNAILSSSKETTCKAKISVDQKNNKTQIVYTLSDGDYTLQYNSGNPRFAAYSSNQNPIQLYKASDKLLEDSVETGVGSVTTESESVIAIYDINGRIVNTTSTDGLEKGLYIIITNNGTRKILK